MDATAQALADDSLDDGALADGALADRLRAGLLRRRGRQPLWTRLRDEIAAAIAEGALRPGMRMPGERLLAAELGVSRMTLRHALDALAEGGLLRRRQGAATEVAPRIEKAVSRLVGFSEDMRARGREPGARLILRAVGWASAAEAAALGLGEEAGVTRIERVRLADGRPVAIERAVLPAAVLPDPAAVEGSLYEALGARGRRPVGGTQRLRAVAASRADARHLGCVPGEPLLAIERRCVDGAGRPVEFTETRYLGGAYDFLTDLVT